jgi:hypothetical protein
MGLGARQARRTLGIALAELTEAGVLEAGEAERVAADVLAGTARRIYFRPGDRQQLSPTMDIALYAALYRPGAGEGSPDW